MFFSQLFVFRGLDHRMSGFQAFVKFTHDFMSGLLSVLGGLLTPTIAAAVAYIAYQQWKTARDKLRLDLFDRRIVIWEAVDDFLWTVVVSEQTPDNSLSVYLRRTANAHFLFSHDVVSYLDEIRKNAMECDMLKRELPINRKDKTNQRDRYQRQQTLLRWIQLQAEGGARQRFSPYLSFPHKSKG